MFLFGWMATARPSFSPGPRTIALFEARTMSDDPHLTDAPREDTCPECGRAVSRRRTRCRHCGASLLDEPPDVDLRRLRRQSEDVDPVQFIVPTNVSAWSLISCYAGLIGMCLPIIGLVFALPAFICGIIALRRRKKAANYGAVTSDVRAILGLVFSSIALLLWGGLGLAALLGSLK
jgi:hypothetical protein